MTIHAEEAGVLGADAELTFDAPIEFTFDPVFVHPAGGGELTVTTTMISIDDSEVDVEETFELEGGATEFLRGDVDGGGTVGALVDALFLLRWAFDEGDDPPCMAAADVDGGGTVGALVDSLYLLNWAFGDGDDPPAPGTEECGIDPNELECETGC